MAKKAKYNIAKIIEQWLPSLKSTSALSGHQVSTLKLIQHCKTAQLGGHIERCDSCAYTRIHYNSCGNRNCPSCQGVNKEKWIFDRQFDLIAVKYFHCVFTIPSQLHDLVRYNKKIIYDLMMRCVKDTLLAFGNDPKHGINGKIGAILILHTWNQQLGFHPHVHCIVPAGGLSKHGKWNQAKSNGDFLFPVRALSSLFKGKLLHGIHKLYLSNKLYLSPRLKAQYWNTKNKLYGIKWNTYSKKAFGGPQQVLEYVGRYTHKICISNQRINCVSDHTVSFKYLDRKLQKSKAKKIKGEQFLKLFAEHILPKGFVRIRHIGFLASRKKSKDLAIIRRCLKSPTPIAKPLLSTREFIKLTTGKDPYLCPCCQKGEMVIISVLPSIRGSPISSVYRTFAKDRKVQIM